MVRFFIHKEDRVTIIKNEVCCCNVIAKKVEVN